MGIHLLKDEIHSKMVLHGKIFFKHGLGLKKKYHMVKWDTLMTPKDFGGLGFTNTRVMNECILEKWIFKRERGMKMFASTFSGRNTLATKASSVVILVVTMTSTMRLSTV